MPTTAGTAAEVTINYVITDVEKKAQVRLRGYQRYPEIAVVDPDMMSSMPKGLTAATGMDALTHAIEGYITKGHCVISDMFHLEAIKLISQSLRGAVQNTWRAARAWLCPILPVWASPTWVWASCTPWHTACPPCMTPPRCGLRHPAAGGSGYNKSVAGERYRAVGKAMGVMGIDEMNDVEAADATIAACQAAERRPGHPTPT